MHWVQSKFGNPEDPKAETIYSVQEPDANLPGGAFYVVGEQAGEWQVVYFWRDGGNCVVSRHPTQECAFGEVERLLAEAKTRSEEKTERASS